MWKEFKGMGHGMIYFPTGKAIWSPIVLNGRVAARRYVWKLLSGRQGKVEGLKPIKKHGRGKEHPMENTTN